MEGDNGEGVGNNDSGIGTMMGMVMVSFLVGWPQTPSSRISTMGPSPLPTTLTYSLCVIQITA